MAVSTAMAMMNDAVGGRRLVGPFSLGLIGNQAVSREDGAKSSAEFLYGSQLVLSAKFIPAANPSSERSFFPTCSHWWRFCG
jgi:hypothetical protein